MKMPGQTYSHVVVAASLHADARLFTVRVWLERTVGADGGHGGACEAERGDDAEELHGW